MPLAFAIAQIVAQQPCRTALVYRNDDHAITTSGARDDYLVAVPAESTRLVKSAVYALDIVCSAQIVDFRSQHVVLRDGRALLVPQEGGELLPADRFGQRSEPVPALSPPRLDGRAPFATAALGTNGKFLGLWRDGDRFTLAGFSEKSARPPTVIATTHRAIEHLSYWGGPHQGSGVIDFISRDGARAKLVRYRWDHDAFLW